MHVLPFILIVAAMIVVILVPHRVNSILLWRVHPEARPPAARLVPVALVIAFAFTFLGFHTMLPVWRQNQFTMSGPVQMAVGVVGGAMFFAYGFFACLRPIRFVSTFSPRLRHETRSLSRRSLVKVEAISRSFGVLLVLASAFLFVISIR
jgi:hypothetical protein